jgi:hypothetical protein
MCNTAGCGGACLQSQHSGSRGKEDHQFKTKTLSQKKKRKKTKGKKEFKKRKEIGKTSVCDK